MAGLLFLALLMLGASALYTLWLNPEVAFFTGSAKKKLLWSEKMTRESGPKTVFYGGSSCMFSVDAERLLQEHRLPAVNAGLGAGMGPKVLTRFALSQTKTGDTMVVALEPDLLGSPLEHPSLGIQFSVAMGHSEWLDGWKPGERFPRLSAGLALRPGGYHFFTLLGKCFSRKPLYRYSATEVSASGWQQTAVRMPIPPIGPAPAALPTEVKRWLSALQDYCRRQRIELAYSLPWGFVPVEDLPITQKANAKFLLEISEFMPVLKDPRLGCYAVNEHFADTSWHLVPEAARLRTDELADEIQHRRFWTRAELAAWVDPKAGP